jgi:hypothetical protein
MTQLSKYGLPFVLHITRPLVSFVSNILSFAIVSCFLDRFTATLDLHNNIFRNSIPTQLGQLTALKVLDLGDDQLTGQIPTQLGLLSDLGESKATWLAYHSHLNLLFLTSYFLLFYLQMGYR